MDLNGDSKPDLIYTDEQDSNGVWGGDGAAYWKVFLNTGAGFATSAVKWSVPARGVQTGFQTVAGAYWATMDLDGDDKPDLVYTNEVDSKGVWGGDAAAHWKVYLNTGSGFASKATSWSVPARGVQNGFESVAGKYWATMDLDGDGKPDLVYTNEADSQGVWGGDGAAYWKVFLNTGSGFASTATHWAVPARGTANGFASIADGSFWTTMDLDGDDKPDLVYTAEQDSNGVWGGDGAAYWKVFLNTGSGFAAKASSWSIPARGVTSGFETASGSYWATTDLDGDGKVDLVYTNEADSKGVWGGDGAAYWRVFLNTGSGFAPKAAHWSIPARGVQGGFQTVAGDHWATTDLDGDGKADLVYTNEVDSNGVWGGDSAAHWKLYLGKP